MTSESEQPEQQPGPPPPTDLYPPMYGYPQRPPGPVNGMAIAAMVLGIVGVCNPISVLGLIFGVIAKRQIRERGEQGDGFAVTGIVLGWIGVASIVFWILYVIFIVTLTGSIFNEIAEYDPDSWPTDDSTDFLVGR